MEKLEIKDAVLIGEYKEVESLDLETITRASDDKGKKLSGLLLYGYETKFNHTNTNGERYSKECFDDFVERYYIANKLNIPLTIQHGTGINDLAGRVLICEVTNVGFYFVCYVPKSLPNYEHIKALIQEGILQGLSKEGWATDYEPHYDRQGVFEYFTIKKMDLLAVSLVTTPANGAKLEKTKEIKNATKFVNNARKADFDDLDELFC